MLTAACQGDESVSAYLDGAAVFNLMSIDGISAQSAATIDLGEAGRITGRAPCNTYFADQTAPYPWFAIGPIGATRMACPDLEAEGHFFTSLSDMTLAEVLGDTLILSNPAGREMVFQAP